MSTPMNTPSPDNWTPAHAYAQRSNDIARLIDVLQTELKAHAELATKAGSNWGYPGDLSHIRDGLIELVAALSSQERIDIERFLDEPGSPESSQPPTTTDHT